MRTRALGSIEVSEIGMGCMGLSHGYGPILYEELARPWTSDSKGRGSDAQSVGVPGHSAPRSPDTVASISMHMSYPIWITE